METILLYYYIFITFYRFYLHFLKLHSSFFLFIVTNVKYNDAVGYVIPRLCQCRCGLSDIRQGPFDIFQYWQPVIKWPKYVYLKHLCVVTWGSNLKNVQAFNIVIIDV